MFEKGLLTRKRKKDISPLITGAGALAAAAFAAGGWMVYNKVAVDREKRLPRALDAEQQVFTSERAGGLSYYSDLTSAGRPLVLLHSINAAASAMEVSPLFVHYRGSRPVYALDLPGFGFSERSDREYNPHLYNFAIVDFLAAVVGEPADVVAMSLTSEFAAQASIIAPELFHSLALISPTGLGRQSSNRSAGSGPSHGLLSFKLWERPLYNLIASRRSIQKFLNMSFSEEAPPELVDYAYRTSHQPGAQYAPLHFLSGSLFTPEVEIKVYDRVSRPTLALYDRDPFTGFELLPDLAARSDYWTAVRIPNTCGLPHWEQPTRTFEALDHFWSMIS